MWGGRVGFKVQELLEGGLLTLMLVSDLAVYRNRLGLLSDAIVPQLMCKLSELFGQGARQLWVLPGETRGGEGLCN